MNTSELTKREKSIKKHKTIVWCTFLLGCSTLIPFPYAFHINTLGYNSLCSFTPISTSILWGLAGMIALYPKRVHRKNLFRQSLLFLFTLLFFYGFLNFAYLGCVGILSFEWKSLPPFHLETIQDGEYLGYSSNLGKKVVMKVHVQESTIQHIETISSGYASEKFGMQAFKYLPEQIILSQSIQVDTISGATHSSWQIQTAVHDALYNASNPKNTNQPARKPNRRTSKRRFR
ncbi:MAG TPA: FMN-binding protein [Planctomycetota bacterium]|nr:FMN-binding protein [Planctomycetota bacterium]HRU52055.1 FMN-binding protein [Planctomycetota bacterium]